MTPCGDEPHGIYFLVKEPEAKKKEKNEKQEKDAP